MKCAESILIRIIVCYVYKQLLFGKLQKLINIKNETKLKKKIFKLCNKLYTLSYAHGPLSFFLCFNVSPSFLCILFIQRWRKSYSMKYEIHSNVQWNAKNHNHNCLLFFKAVKSLINLSINQTEIKRRDLSFFR